MIEQEPEQIKKRVLHLSEQLGFALCRVAECRTPPHGPEFQAWLKGGYAGEMQWMEKNRERRLDPDLVLPGAKTMLVFATNYYQGNPAGSQQTDQPSGRIARYAWGEDYHDIILKRLREIDNFLISFGGQQKCYVDTGPILERDFAAQSGVGWHGKSTMLINRKLGAYFFLSEILTTLELPVDAPVREHCGSCTRCITACPTGAITEPYRLDARRCVSYLTIELKGAIPIELRPLIGNRIYGCDDCLDACPWNRFAKASSESAFAARESTAGMSLTDYLSLTPEKFRQLFKNSPIKRTKHRGFLRNVCVALGNIGHLEDIPALEKAVDGGDPLIAEHASWAIGQIRSRAQRDELTGTSKNSIDLK